MCLSGAASLETEPASLFQLSVRDNDIVDRFVIAEGPRMRFETVGLVNILDFGRIVKEMTLTSQACQPVPSRASYESLVAR